MLQMAFAPAGRARANQAEALGIIFQRGVIPQVARTSFAGN
jgi:hypothetical protein